MEIDLFIVGCERSGSTWLCNILDNSPNTELFVEPFNMNTCRDEILTNRQFLTISMDQDEIIKMLKSLIDSLNELKYPFFYHPTRLPALRSLDFFIYKILKPFSFLNRRLLVMLTNYFELNFSYIYSGRRFPRKKDVKINIVKEFRLNFKLQIIKKTFQRSKFLILVRNPSHQALSIQKLFQEGSLVELKETIIDSNIYFENVGSMFNIDFHLLGEIERILYYLTLNYRYLFDNFSQSKTIFYEELLSNPFETTHEIISWLGLKESKHISDYLKFSTSNTAGYQSANSKYITLKKNHVHDRKRYNEISTLFKNQDFWKILPDEVKNYYY